MFPLGVIARLDGAVPAVNGEVGNLGKHAGSINRKSGNRSGELIGRVQKLAIRRNRYGRWSWIDRIKDGGDLERRTWNFGQSCGRNGKQRQCQN